MASEKELTPELTGELAGFDTEGILKNVIYPSLDTNELKVEIKELELLVLIENGLDNIKQKVGKLKIKPDFATIIIIQQLMRSVASNDLPVLAAHGYSPQAKKIAAYLSELGETLEDLTERLQRVEML